MDHEDIVGFEFVDSEMFRRDGLHDLIELFLFVIVYNKFVGE
jgi:hypothetical protein